jgi:hypothetical protein
MRRSRFLLIGSLLASSLPAQARPSGHVVTGLVFDSVASEPLAGAVVQIVYPDSGGRTFSAVSDAAGRSRIVGLPSGRVAIGFQHRALEALGLESPVTAVELGAKANVNVDLAIPSGKVVRAQRCGNAAKDTADGMLAGFAIDAGRDSYLRGAVVEVQWLELVRKGGNFGSAPQRVTAKVGDDGVYLACGIPGGAWVNVRIAQPGYRAVDGHTAVSSGSAARLDFRLVDSTVTHGTAALTGHVLRGDRTPLASGRATISALGVEAPIHDGEFSLTGLPAGTWDVEAQSIGYEPHSTLVQLTEHETVSTLITITKTPQALDAMSIIGKPGRDLKVLDAIVARNRVSNGTMFLPGNIYLENALVVGDVLRAASGFSGGPRGCRFVRGKRLAVYLDGSRVLSGLAGLNDLIPIHQVLAVEAYPDAVSAPFLWRTTDACAVIAVWTKR